MTTSRSPLSYDLRVFRPEAYVSRIPQSMVGILGYDVAPSEEFEKWCLERDVIVIRLNYTVFHFYGHRDLDFELKMRWM